MAANVPGDLLIFICFICNIAVGVLFYLVAKGKTNFEHLAKTFYNVFVGAAVLAAAYLFYLFFSENYQIKYVYSYSDSSLEFFYRISSFWGGQEGTYLLWLLFNAFFGYIILYRSGIYRNFGMVIYSAVNLFFLFLMIKLSPFAMWDGVPEDGAGLNPLLQDPWMVIHPPMMFLGYSVSAVPFSIAMAALIMGDFSEWIKRAFPWAAFTALMLAAGNILGGYWAYVTLGWGGFWAWDPVENSSFIPWFVSLAFVHGLIIEKRSGALRKSNLLMASFVFILVVYGTFLTRSGVLADFSVHSFVDLGINQYLVFFLILYLVITVVMFNRTKVNLIIGSVLLGLFVLSNFDLVFTNWSIFQSLIKAINYMSILDVTITVFILANVFIMVPLNNKITKNGMIYNIYHKDFLTFAGMICLFMFSLVVLGWTSLPILTNIFSDNPRAADLATYNDYGLPFAIIYTLFLTITPFLPYARHNLENWVLKYLVAYGVSAVLGFGLFWFLLGETIVFAIVFTLAISTLAMYLMKKDLFFNLVPSLVGFVLTIIISVLAGVESYFYLLFFGFSAMAIISNVQAVIKYFPHNMKLAGAQVCHFGFGLMLIGILASSAYTSNQKIILPVGESDTAYDLNVTYKGMQNDVYFPKNNLILTIDEGGSTHEAKPQFYYSQKTEAIMRKPYVDMNLMYDLYFSPEEIKNYQNTDGTVTLVKDKPKQVEDFILIFRNYEIGTPDEYGNMKVFAEVEYQDKDTTMMLKPSVIVETVNNKNKYTDVPDQLGNDPKKPISIVNILVDQEAVEVGLGGVKQKERLILDISKKPIINFVWLGTILIIFGSLIVFIRRKDEMQKE